MFNFLSPFDPYHLGALGPMPSRRVSCLCRVSSLARGVSLRKNLPGLGMHQPAGGPPNTRSEEGEGLKLTYQTQPDIACQTIPDEKDPE